MTERKDKVDKDSGAKDADGFDHHAPASEHPRSEQARLSSELAGAETLGTGRAPSEIRKDLEELRPDADGLAH